MFYDNFLDLCNERNIKPSYVAKETGIPLSTIYKWRDRGSEPSLANLKILADYFDVSIECVAARDKNTVFYRTFIGLCEKKKIRPGTAAKQAGIDVATVYQWRDLGSAPSNTDMKKLADYFNVPIKVYIDGRSVIAFPDLIPLSDKEFYELDSKDIESEDIEEKAPPNGREARVKSLTEKVHDLLVDAFGREPTVLELIEIEKHMDEIVQRSKK